MIQRFIPACAGNSDVVPPASISMTVHPRVCGEQGAVRNGRTAAYGSSPRVRGTGPRKRVDPQRTRFIPACAGNSLNFRDRHIFSPVHPRVCGEQKAGFAAPLGSIGSSPRVRGTVFYAVPPREGSRFIPACAGNRVRMCRACRLAAVHPRVCGEQPISPSTSAAAPGSSPRVRGTVGLFWCDGRSFRFIPACAGNRRE